MSGARLAFAGLGWIGRARLESLVADGARPVGYLEPDDAGIAAARQVAAAPVAEDLDDLIDLRPDGIVIATPNHLHPLQARTAAEHGIPVFCQKPLADRHRDAEGVVTAAEDADVLLSVDWSYRGTRALQALRRSLHDGDIGACYRAELSFHNAYGPDKPWYRDAKLSGGGCLLDLGCHLFDALQWLLPDEQPHVTHAELYQQGRPAGRGDVEDHAVVSLQGRDMSAQVQSSWDLPTGGDAEVRIRLYGTKGTLALDNIDGSFFDFRAALMQGTSATTLADPPDPWGGRQAVAWAQDVAAGRTRFHEDAWLTAHNARLIEECYRCAS